MSCTDARDPVPPTRTWKTHLSVLFCLAGAVLLAYLGHRFAGPGALRAQVPGAQPPSRRVPAAPAAGAPGRGVVKASATAPIPSRTPAGAAARNAEPARAETAPDVVALVNGQRVTREDLARESVRRYGKDVLESIVNRHLIFQACQQRGIAITDEDVETEIERVAKRFSLPKDRWLQLLEQEREVNADHYRREIIWPTLALRRLASESTTVSAEELQRAFEAEYGPKVKVRLISVSTRSKAEQIHAKAVAQPEQFGDLAKEFSEDPNSASARGLVPPIRKHMGEPELERIAFGLKKGEISPVIEVANQFILLKCEEQIEESYVASQQIPAIQEQLRDRIRDEKLRSAAGDIFRKLQEQAKVVNVLNDPKLQAQYPGVAALINGRAINLAVVAEECMTRHGQEVLEGEINRLLLVQELKRQGKVVENSDVDEEVRRAADAYGYLQKDGSPDVDAWLKAVTEADEVSVELYVRDAVWPSVALKKLVSHEIEITEDDLQKGFEANYGERVEVLAIVVSNQRQAQSVWEMARSNPTEQFFGELAQQYSIEPVSKANSGKVPPIRRHGGQPVVEEEAFRLKPGELSGILAVGDKYIILRCRGRTEPVVQDFEAVKSELASDIREKKLRVEMAREFDRIRESAQIDNFLAGTTQSGKAQAGPPGPISPATALRGIAPPGGNTKAPQRR